MGGIAAFTRAPHGRSSASSDGLVAVSWRSAWPATARRMASAFGGSIVTLVFIDLPAWSTQTQPSAFSMISVTVGSSMNGESEGSRRAETPAGGGGTGYRRDS